MSSFAFMKVLESSPNRYDRGIKILSHGRIAEVYLKIAEMVAGVLIMVGGIVGGGAIYAGLEKLVDAIKNKDK